MDDPVARRNYLALKQRSYAISFNLDGTGYTAIENIGTGAYGVVCSAMRDKTQERVAIKKIPGIFEQSTIAKRTFREIKILKHFKHDNVIAIQEILHPKESLDNFKDVYIVLDLMESDLHRIIHSAQPLTEEHVRFFTYQILRGLKYVHSANVVHRDLKPSNLLVNENCDLKIGDFGMARGISTNMNDYSMVMTQYVATRWYRAPELMILPKETYTEAVDMWSVGCILGEMLGRKQLFPGKSHIDQLEKIIDKLGTPSVDYLKLTSSPVITALILKQGQIKPTSWQNVYPKASKSAVNLLEKMLILDPKKRITVNEALKHPFLEKYHDADDEPICIPVFNFDFERENLTTQQLKQVIIKEILEYHRPKPKPQFNFRPVPKAELAATTSPPANSSKFNFTPVPSSELSSKIQQKPQQPASGLEAFLQFQNIKKTSGSDTKPDVFKKPDSQALFVKVEGQKKDDDVVLIKSGNDVEMPSAKSNDKVLSVLTKEEPSVDIEMPSAQGTGKGQPQQEVTAQKPAENQKPVDTKELIRMALLSNDRKKMKEESSSRPKPVTALQRQREREEKKRQKLEKAKQKKKKAKENSSAVVLTDEDKKLLMKWQQMQQPNTGQNSKQQQQPQQPPQQSHREGSPASTTAGLTEALKNTTLKPVPGSQKPEVLPQAGGIPQNTIPNFQPANTPATSDLMNPAGQFPEGFPNLQTSQLGGAVADQSVPFAWLSNTSTTSGTVLSNSSVVTATETNPKPQDWPGISQPSKDPVPVSTVTDPILPGTSSNVPASLDQLQQTQWLLSNLEDFKGEAGDKPKTNKADNEMHIITKQLRQSMVEDLTLTNTPKGTGGGYGVACDLDLTMESAGSGGRAEKPDSAALSPSLYTDWQELTGNIDPHEFETVLQDYMTSPISSQELNNVMLALMSPRASAGAAGCTNNTGGEDGKGQPAT